MVDERTEMPLFDELGPQQTLSDRVAETVLERIISKRLQPGDRLPSERALGEQFGVSRTVVREAVRSLVARGVIEVRSGSGLRVAQIRSEAVSDFMSLYLRGRGTLDYGKVQEVRETIELRIVQLACERATTQDLDTLRAAHARMERAVHDFEEASAADVEFHRTIAKITHNELFLVMLDSIGDILADVRRRATLGIKGRTHKALNHHHTILERILARDASGAEAAMRAHLDDVSKAMAKLSTDSGPPA